jgi:hypothetical protein
MGAVAVLAAALQSIMHAMNGSLNHVSTVSTQVMFRHIFGGQPLEVHDELKTDGRATRGCLAPVALTTF